MFLSPLKTFGECLLPKRTKICQEDKSHLKVRFTLQNSGNSQCPTLKALQVCSAARECCVARRAVLSICWCTESSVQFLCFLGMCKIGISAWCLHSNPPGEDDVELLSQVMIVFQERSWYMVLQFCLMYQLLIMMCYKLEHWSTGAGKLLTQS